MINDNKIRNFVSKNKLLIENMSYLSLLEVFIMVAPLLTYPYLVRVLGLELYGFIITAQALASYASKIIDFGSNKVCAKHVAINRGNECRLSEIFNSVLIIRISLCLICFLIYLFVVLLVDLYRNYLLLFILSYGLTFNEVLFPQYFFQGMEKMRYSSLINILIKLLFIVLVFFVVKNEGDYLLVPVMYSIGYIIAGLISLYIVYKKMGLNFYFPKMKEMSVYFKDSMPIFATDMICLVKDKLSYFIMGPYAGMSNVVLYDLGLKINSLLVKPVQIISMAIFPQSARIKEKKRIKKILYVVSILSISIVLMANVFLKPIVEFFIANQDVNLLPIRIFTLAPIFLSVSTFLSSNIFVAWGYNKYMLYSIIITVLVYVITLILVFMSGHIASMYAFVLIALVSYFVELIYRIIISAIIVNLESKKQGA